MHDEAITEFPSTVHPAQNVHCTDLLTSISSASITAREAISVTLLSGETGEQGLSVAVGLEGRGGPSWLGKVSPPFKRRRGRVVGS